MPFLRHTSTGEIVQAATNAPGYDDGWAVIDDPAPNVPMSQQTYNGAAWVQTSMAPASGRIISGGLHPLPVVPVAGAFTSVAVNALALTTLVGAANRLDLVPFAPSMNVRIDQMAVEVTTLLAGGNARIGVYASTATGAPGALIGGSGVLDCSTLGVRTWDMPVTLDIDAGRLVWLSLHSSAATAAFRAIALGALFPLAAPASGTAHATIRRATGVTFANGLPATAPATTETSSVAPWHRLRLAS